MRKERAYSGDLFAALVAAIGVTVGTGCVGVVYPEPVYRHAHEACRVPRGHLPPPGECRLWYPDRPPGQQPPPSDCDELQHHAPAGACLVYGE